MDQKIKDILNEFRVSFDVWFSETSLYMESSIDKNQVMYLI